MAVNSVIGTEFLKARSTTWWMELYLSRGPRCGKHMASTLECQWFYDTPLWAYRVVRLKSALLGCWSFDLHWLSSALSFEMLECQMAATVHAATWCLRQLTTSQHKPSWNASLKTNASNDSISQRFYLPQNDTPISNPGAQHRYFIELSVRHREISPGRRHPSGTCSHDTVCAIWWYMMWRHEFFGGIDNHIVVRLALRENTDEFSILFKVQRSSSSVIFSIELEFTSPVSATSRISHAYPQCAWWSNLIWLNPKHNVDSSIPSFWVKGSIEKTIPKDKWVKVSAFATKNELRIVIGPTPRWQG